MATLTWTIGDATVTEERTDEKTIAMLDLFLTAYGHDVAEMTTQQKLEAALSQTGTYWRDVAQAQARKQAEAQALAAIAEALPDFE